MWHGLCTLAVWLGAMPSVSAAAMLAPVVLPDVAVPSLLFQDEQILIVAKPANMPLLHARKGSALLGKPLLNWARDELSVDAPLVPATPLADEIHGLALLAKTDAAAELLRAHADAIVCEYVAVVGGAPDDHGGAACGRLGLE